MIHYLKKRSVSRHIQQLEALLRRLPLHHEKRVVVEDEYRGRLAGYRGERAIDYDLTFLKKDDYYALCDVRLANENGDYFQMDTLLMCPSHFIILESKNLSGSVLFDTQTHQIIQKRNGIHRYMRDPIIQVNRQKQQLEEWLLRNKYSAIPVKTQVVLSNTETEYKTNDEHKFVFQQVTVKENLPARLIKFEDEYQKDILSIKELKKIGKAMVKQHVRSNPDLLKVFDIKKEELIQGVFCPNANCGGSVLVKRLQSKWRCTGCLKFFKDSEVDMLRDYMLLISDTITNAQFREFTGISSIYMASRMLKAMQLEHSGKTKGKTYKFTLPES